MDFDLIIWVSVIVGIIVVVGLHMWLHKLVKFKMDESTIVTYLKSVKATEQFINVKQVSDQVDIVFDRVFEVSKKSQLMMSDITNEDTVLIKLV